MIKSAGVLVYRYNKNNLEVLMCHFGGPYREHVDKGGWSIPKGEVDGKEKLLDCAKREFFEETNLKITTELKYLGSHKVSHRKLAIIFYTCCDYDLSHCKSNTFEIEYPKGSSKMQSFPEMDRFLWMDIETAKEKIVPSQIYFLEKLEDSLKK